MQKTRELIYGGRIPDDYLPAHNHIIHTPETIHGERGFRKFWIPPEYVSSGKWVECPCGWKAHGVGDDEPKPARDRKWNAKGIHYAKAEHVGWLKEEIEKRGSLDAVYQHINARLKLSYEHPDWNDNKIKQELT